MTALRLFLWATLLCGFVYPGAITLIGQLLFHENASGSPVFLKNECIGHALIGQKFTAERYFWGRPSQSDYNPIQSGGSNLGPTSKQLVQLVQERREKIAAAHNVAPSLVPKELLFASGSGLDPHISVECALFQVKRIAKTRNIDEKTIVALVHLFTAKRSLHIFGFDIVNVLLLNRALDEIA